MFEANGEGRPPCRPRPRQSAALPENDEMWYPEAMQYYLRRIETGNGELPPSGIKQFEFDFAPRVYRHPDLEKLLRLDEAGVINKYDAPILHPLADACRSGNGVTECELQMISHLVGKYDVDSPPSMAVDGTERMLV